MTVLYTQISLHMKLPHDMCRHVMCWSKGDITDKLIKRHPVEVAACASIDPGTELLLIDHAVIELPMAPYLEVFSDIELQLNDTRLYLKLIEITEAERNVIDW